MCARVQCCHLGRQEDQLLYVCRLNDGGIVDGSAFSRYTARVKAEYQAKKWLKVGEIWLMQIQTAKPPADRQTGVLQGTSFTLPV